MRIKIPKRGLCTTPYRDGPGGGPVEEEEVKMDAAAEQTHQLVVADSAELKTGEENLALAIPATPSPASKGKRKMKPKELHSDICYQTKKRGRRPSLTHSKNVESGSAGKSNRKHKTAAVRSRSAPEVKTPAMIRAEELRSSLGSEFPSFVRVMVRTHVATCFLMGIPMPFCKLHLPKSDTIVTLEDESGGQAELKYLPEKAAFSAGWRKFAIGHNLLAGDVLIFQLVEPLKFKVHIVRAKDLDEVNGTLTLVSLDTSSKHDDTGKYEAENGKISETKAQNGKTSGTNKKRKCVKSTPLSTVRKKIKRICVSKLSSNSVPFKDVKSFNDFNILVNGVCIDSDLPDHVRYKYYKLCCTRNAYVHGHLLRGLNAKLVAGVISETVNIADAIRACKVTTSKDDFATWEKTLRSFELMGMKVGFMRARVRRLLDLAFGSGDAEKAKIYVEAKTGRARAEEEIKKLEAKVVELKAASDKYGDDMENLEIQAERYGKKFQEEVDAPW